MIILDTTFLIDLLRGQRSLLGKRAQLEEEKLVTSEINVFEVMTGIHGSTKQDIQKDLTKAIELFSFLPVLPLDRASSLKAAEIAGKLKKAGQKIGELDCLTAGIAQNHGITKVITEDKSHFERFPGIKVLTY